MFDYLIVGAGFAGSVLAVYVGMLGGADPASQAKFATYLLCASIMNAPAAIVMSKIVFPETEPEKIDSTLNLIALRGRERRID